MNRGQRAAVLIDVAQQLLNRGSWCGETHLQKATYLLQDICGVGTQFDFILYKHGPFSFDLRDCITELVADGLVDSVVRHPSYGPTIVPTTDASQFITRFPKTLSKYSRQIEFVANAVRDKGVSELERLATAVFVAQKRPKASVKEKIAELVELKPHISYEQAQVAFQDASCLMHDAAQALCATSSGP